MQRNGTSSLLTLTDREREQWLADQANRQPGSVSGFECPECLNRGYTVHVDETGHRYTRECRCMVRRRSEKIMEQSGLSELLTRYTMRNWECREPWQKNVLHLAREWAENPSGWFFLAGTPGTGKTHLCVALCGVLMTRGLACRYMLWRDMAVRAKAAVNDEAEYQQIVEPLKMVRVLYIDDLFKTGRGQEPTAADVNLAFEILNARYNDSRKITILSSEWTLESILNLDEGVGSRIYERTKGYYFDLTGRKNWRLI